MYYNQRNLTKGSWRTMKPLFICEIMGEASHFCERNSDGILEESCCHLLICLNPDRKIWNILGIKCSKIKYLKGTNSTFFSIHQLVWSDIYLQMAVKLLNIKERNQKQCGHTTYRWNIKGQKCAGISGLWVLNEIIQKKYPENMKKIVGAVWKLPAK